MVVRCNQGQLSRVANFFLAVIERDGLSSFTYRRNKTTGVAEWAWAAYRMMLLSLSLSSLITLISLIHHCNCMYLHSTRRRRRPTLAVQLSRDLTWCSLNSHFWRTRSTVSSANRPHPFANPFFFLSSFDNDACRVSLFISGLRDRTFLCFLTSFHWERDETEIPQFV